MALLYLDPESSPARGLARLAPDGEHAVPERARVAVVESFRAYLDGSGSHEAIARTCERLITSLARDAPPSRLDPRIMETLYRLDAIRGRRPRVSELASHVALSPSRFSHLFRAQTGLPLRRYQLWLRLQQAVRAAGRGESLTTLAHAAGFADSAHLARTFRRMFGLAPRDLLAAFADRRGPADAADP